MADLRDIDQIIWLARGSPSKNFFYRESVLKAKENFYKTSGAKETILVKLKSLNSRATGPKTRVPLGFPS